MPKEIKNCDEIEILEYLKNGMEIIDENKNEYGEVFTPLALINEVLDELPRSIWLNRDVKWLDPAAGIGNFAAVVYLRLLKSLAHVIPNETERKRHILENMLYMVEINPANVSKMRRFFGTKGTNISLADFLENQEKWKRDLGTSEFHVIMGNPPFQSKKSGVYKGSAGHRTLWDKFVVMALSQQHLPGTQGRPPVPSTVITERRGGGKGEPGVPPTEGFPMKGLESSFAGFGRPEVPPILRDNGFLAFLTPGGWRRPESDLYELMTRKNRLLFLHIYGKQAGLDILNAESRFDLYIIQKARRTAVKKIIDENGKTYKQFDILTWPFLPNFAFDKIQKILVKPERGIQVIFDSSRYYAQKLSDKKTAKYKYPVVHGITQEGLGIRYADNRDESQFGVPKVILNFNERQYPYVDSAGEYGMSQLSFGIPIKSKMHGEQWSKAILSPFFEEVLRATKWGAFQTDYRMFKYFDAKLYKRREIKGTLSNKNKTDKRSTRKINFYI